MDQWVALESVLGKIEADVLADLGSALVPGLLAEVVHFIPAAEQPIANAIIPALEAPLQQALQSLLAKIPQLPKGA